jgi:hypothetical protein
VSRLLLSPRKLIAVSLYELIFSPLLLAVTPGDAGVLRWLLAVGFALGVVGLWIGVSLYRQERRR